MSRPVVVQNCRIRILAALPLGESESTHNPPPRNLEMTQVRDHRETALPEVVLFDAGGTLFQVKEPVGFVYAAIAEDFGWKLDAVQVQVAFKLAWAAMPGLWGGVGESDPEKDWWAMLVRRVLGESGVPDPGTGFPEYFERLWGHYASADAWTLYPEVMTVLGALAPNHRLGVISNFDSRIFPLLEGLGIADCFEAVTISSRVGVRKPDPVIFEAALRAHGVPASRALHVGDEPEADWAGAARSGLRWFELRRPQITLADLLVHMGVRQDEKATGFRSHSEKND
ncbi:MAG: HAD-IA family hydrolase [Verrucomicrobiales bacterium]